MKLEVLYGCPNLGIISAPWGYSKETPDVIQKNLKSDSSFLGIKKITLV